jgi:preprotein translocase subunit SecE
LSKSISVLICVLTGSALFWGLDWVAQDSLVLVIN